MTTEEEKKYWNFDIHRVRKAAEARFVGSPNLRAVYLAVLRMGERDRTAHSGLEAHWRVPVRVLAEWSNVERSTAGDLLRILERKGFLVNVFAGNEELAGVWALGPESIKLFQNSDSTHSILWEYCPKFEKSYWPNGLLNNGSEVVWCALTDKGQSPGTIGKSVNLAYNTVAKYLAQLRKHGLADVDTRSGWVRGTVTPEEAGEKMGAAQIAQEKKDKHAKEREGWAEAKDARWLDTHPVGTRKVTVDGEVQEVDADVLFAWEIWLAFRPWDAPYEFRLCSSESEFPPPSTNLSVYPRYIARTCVFFDVTPCLHCGGHYDFRLDDSEGNSLAWRCETCGAAVRIFADTGDLRLGFLGGRKFGEKFTFLGECHTDIWHFQKAPGCMGRYTAAQDNLERAWVAYVVNTGANAPSADDLRGLLSDVNLDETDQTQGV